MKDCQNGNEHAASPDCALTYRILDANFNRASEGYRVAEEYARFSLEDALLTRRLKEARHLLTQNFQQAISEITRLAFRETQTDVGTNIATNCESQRKSPAEVAQASFKRVEQALRSLEEYGKIVSANFASQCELLRYEIYTLEKAVLGVRDQVARLAQAHVYVLMNGHGDFETFERNAKEIAECADVIQLRDKMLPDRALLDRAKRLRQITRATKCLFIINDRPDLAVLAHADGVHIGQNELSVAEARQIVGEGALIGVSTHNLRQLHKAVLDGASYLGCGPVFPSRTKEFDTFSGVDFLKSAAKETSLPCFAIGGIAPSNLDQVIDAGFTRVAIQGALNTVNRTPQDVILAMRKKLTAESVRNV